MKKGKSITLLVVISVVLALLIAISFVSFAIPGYKNGTYNYNALVSTLQIDGDVDECYVYELTMKNNLSLEEEVSDINETIDIIQTRLEKLGYKTYSVKAFKANGTDDYNLRIIVTPSYVSGSQSDRLSYTTSDITAVAGFGELTFTDANGTEIFGKEEVKDAYAVSGYVSDDNGGYKLAYMCNIKFTDKAVNLLTNAQGSEEKMTLTIKLGDEELFSDENFKVSNVNDNSIAITGYSSFEAANQKALQISTAGLMYEYEIGDAIVVTPILGTFAKTLFLSIITAIIVAVTVLFAIKYGGVAISVLLSLVATVFLTLLLFVSIPGVNISAATFTGLIATLLIESYLIYNYVNGIYTDFENGKTLKAAIGTSSKRVLLPYIDMGAVVEIIALAVILFAKGVIRDFAISFAIGTVLAVFTGVLFAKWIIKIIYPLAKNKSKFFKLSREDK